jgi:flavin-dependent thymidylate synthase
MMKVELIKYTQDALSILLFTKNTRLMTEPGGIVKIWNWSEEKKQAELDYMRGTIQSSWEFVDYIFLITGVSRAFTHQLVRTRNGSYAQQSQRTVDMSDGDFVMPKGLKPYEEISVFESARQSILEYKYLVEHGCPPQDARSILPTNIATNIIAKFNLRTLADMAKVRLCTRTQGEYQDVFRAMRSEVLKVHPWAEPFIRVACAVNSVCQFPNYLECPIKQHTYNPNTGKAWGGPAHDPDTKAPLAPDNIQIVWENTRFEAVPSEMPKNEERED